MTNAEKFLKEGVSAIEFRKKLAQFIFEELGFYDGTEEAIDEVIGDFLDMIEKPQLTEDERVILKYIDGEYTHIQRADGLWIVHYEESIAQLMSFEMYSHLFQFIKNGQEYSIEELLKR